MIQGRFLVWAEENQKTVSEDTIFFILTEGDTDDTV